MVNELGHLVATSLCSDVLCRCRMSGIKTINLQPIEKDCNQSKLSSFPWRYIFFYYPDTRTRGEPLTRTVHTGILVHMVVHIRLEGHQSAAHWGITSMIIK